MRHWVQRRKEFSSMQLKIALLVFLFIASAASLLYTALASLR